MATIKNIHLISGLIPDPELNKLDHGAELYNRHARIQFKVLNIHDNSILVQVVQSKSPAENYLSKKELAERAKELFGKFFPDRNIHAHTVEYMPPSVDHVTPQWVKRKLEIKGMGQVEITAMTGIPKSNVSAWVSGARPMSQIAKSMFYFMLK